MVATIQPQIDTVARTTWQIDPKHSLVEFSVKHMMFSTVKGRFGGVTGTITLDEADLSRASVDVEVDVSTIDTREEQRDGHLRSADFFDVEQYPTMTFMSTRVEDLGGDRFRLVGDLTIRGITREVSLDAVFNGRGTNPWGQTVAGYSATGEISRKDFGLEWNAVLETGGVLVSDAVKLTLEIQAVRRA